MYRCCFLISCLRYAYSMFLIVLFFSNLITLIYFSTLTIWFWFWCSRKRRGKEHRWGTNRFPCMRWCTRRRPCKSSYRNFFCYSRNLKIALAPFSFMFELIVSSSRAMQHYMFTDLPTTSNLKLRSLRAIWCEERTPNRNRFPLTLSFRAPKF